MLRDSLFAIRTSLFALPNSPSVPPCLRVSVSSCLRAFMFPDLRPLCPTLLRSRFGSLRPCYECQTRVTNPFQRKNEISKQTHVKMPLELKSLFLAQKRGFRKKRTQNQLKPNPFFTQNGPRNIGSTPASRSSLSIRRHAHHRHDDAGGPCRLQSYSTCRTHTLKPHADSGIMLKTVVGQIHLGGIR